ncbi:MAG: hypothetical protein DCF22_25965 [Leptolyngbya sp.]|nr:MAG: hypothetical protein DCF22_25965 [Leptolyngbya sp.]
MSQETSIPEPNDFESQAMPVEGTNLSDSEEMAESAAITNEDLAVLEEDVWESVDIENETQPTITEEVSVEKVAELTAASVTNSKPKSRVASGAAVTATKTTSWQKFQQYWHAEIRPALKEQTIKTLKATIRSLESLVNRLEAQPAASSPQQSTTSWRQFRGIWGSVLGFTRSLLPGSLNRQLSDPLLSGAIGGVLLLTLWIGSPLIFSKPPIQVATAPSVKSTQDKSTNAPKKIISKDEPSQVKPDTEEIANKPRPKQTLLPAPSEKATDAIADSPKPAPTVTPTPAISPIPKPAPALKLTPEQTLIARIQDQVTDVSNQYVNGLIQSVQANFRSSLLTVKVGDDWYTLEQPQQNQLAQEMLKRAQQLDFVKLELTDSAGDLLARSPVVGSEMVILKRTTAVQQIT